MFELATLSHGSPSCGVVSTFLFILTAWKRGSFVEKTVGRNLQGSREPWRASKGLKGRLKEVASMHNFTKMCTKQVQKNSSRSVHAAMQAFRRAAQQNAFHGMQKVPRSLCFLKHLHRNFLCLVCSVAERRSEIFTTLEMSPHNVHARSTMNM